MQAGESLSFIAIPEDLAVQEAQSEAEREAVVMEFALMHRSLLERYGDSFRSIETQEESGMVVVNEGSFQLLFGDGSYLHLVSYSHSDQEGLLDVGLSIAEHTHEGRYVGGYLYELSGEDVRYSYQGAAEGEDEDEQLFHFSIIDMHERNNALYQMQLSEDEGVRSLAEVLWREVEEVSTLGLMERELGFSMLNPTVEDMQKLRALVNLVDPFETPQQENPYE